MTKRYESHKELKRALDRALGYVTPEELFNDLIAGRNPPYDGVDLEEVLAALRSRGPKRGRHRGDRRLGPEEWVGQLFQASAVLFPEVVKRGTLFRLRAEGNLFRDLLKARYGAQWPGETLPDYLWWALRFLAYATGDLGSRPGRRMLTKKDLAIVRLAYVNERKAPAECWPIWNNQNPKWAFTTRRAFATALDRAFRGLVSPFFQLWFQERALAAVKEGPAAVETLFGEVALQFRSYRSALADLGAGQGSSKAKLTRSESAFADLGQGPAPSKAEVMYLPCPSCLCEYYLPALETGDLKALKSRCRPQEFLTKLIPLKKI